MENGEEGKHNATVWQKGKNAVMQKNGKILTGRSLNGTKNLKQILFF